MRKINTWVLFIVMTLLSANGTASSAAKLAIYVLAQDAKFIGDHTGGAEVTVYHEQTGAVLAQGITYGGTGDTRQIMENSQLSSKINKDAAFFLADIAVDKPTPVTIAVKGPLKYPQSIKQLSISTTVYPDRQIHPVVLELPGYIVEGQLDQTSTDRLTIAAKVRMLCGCNLSPDGYWRSGNVYVWAELFSARNKVAAIELNYRDSSTFSADFRLTGAELQLIERVVIHARARDGLHTGRWQHRLKNDH